VQDDLGPAEGGGRAVGLVGMVGEDDLGLLPGPLAEEGDQPLVRLLQRSQCTLRQGMESLVKVEDEMGGLHRFPPMPRRHGQRGQRNEEEKAT